MKAYLIPGAFEDLKDRNYRAVLDVYKTTGYDPKFIKIDWKYNTIDDWVEQVKAKIPKKELQNSLLSGFSWGAMIALTVSTRYANPGKLFLYDLSPYFAEDLPRAKESWLKWAGQRRVENFKRLRIKELSKDIKCPTVLFLGTEDREGLRSISIRINDSKQRLPNCKLVTVKGVGHDVADQKYVEAIRRALNT